MGFHAEGAARAGPGRRWSGRCATGPGRAGTLVLACLLLASLAGLGIPSHGAAIAFVRGTGPYGELERSGAAVAGPAWTNLSPGLPAGPPARSNASVAYDPVDSVYLLYGGEEAGAVLGDTWEFEDGAWVNLTGSLVGGNPGPRFGAGLAFDAADHYFVLFGGNNSSGVVGGTWQFSIGSGRWSSIPSSPSGDPRPRAFPAMAYDPSFPGVVLFGGYNPLNNSAYTWIFVHGLWTQQLPGGPGAPVARQMASFVYDPPDNELLLFGGQTTNLPAGRAPIVLGDTWAYVDEGGTPAWRAVASNSSPAPRTLAAIGFDGTTQKVILFGGSDARGRTLGDAWSFTGGNWSVLTGAHPGPRRGAMMAPSAIPGNPSRTNATGLMLFGGAGPGSWLADCWFFGAVPLGVLPPVFLPGPSFDVNVTINVSALVFGSLRNGAVVAWRGLPAACAGGNHSTVTCAPDQATQGAAYLEVSASGGVLATSGATPWNANPLPTVLAITFTPSSPSPGSPVAVRVTVAGGTPPMTFAYAGLPSGCPSMNRSAIMCVPGTAGTYSVSVTVTDADGRQALSRPVPLVVAAPAAGPPPVAAYLIEGAILVAAVVGAALLLLRRVRGRPRRAAGAPPAERPSPAAAGPPYAKDPQGTRDPSSPPPGAPPPGD